MFSNRIRITLSSILGTPEPFHDDPVNYDQSELDLKRSEKTHGIFLTQINNLEFYGEAKTYLENLFALKGVHAKCNLVREEMHPTTDEWEIHSRGYLDFYTRDIKDGKLYLDFVQGGLRDVLTSQMKERFELNRDTDINGKPIPALQTDVLSNQGRDIYLLSVYAEDFSTFTTKSGEWSSVNEDRVSFHPLPLKIVANSDPLNITTAYPSYGVQDRWELSPANMFFYKADRDRGRTVVKGNVYFKFLEGDGTRINEFNHRLSILRFTSNEDGSNLTMDPIPVFEQNLGSIPVSGQEYSIPIPAIELDVKKNESYAIGIYSVGQYGGVAVPQNLNGWIANTFTDLKANLTWANDSFYGRTINPCLTAYDVGKRQTEIYTGKNCFESRLLDGSDDTFLTDANHNLVFAPGGWLRNLKKRDEDGNELPWPMEINWEDYYNSIHALLPVGYGISTAGNSEKIVLEDLRFFFQRTVVGNLGKITITGRNTAAEYCFQSLSFGYTKGGDYEQPLGLDEFNTITNSRSPLTGTDNKYEATGPSRTDSYGAEDARRKQGKDFPEEDTPYDKDNWLFDVKKVQQTGSVKYFEPRLWQDDFEEAPTGIYSPETAFNLHLSPGWNRYRHSYWWSNAITMLQNENIQFVNSKNNSGLKTKKAGFPALKENELNVPIPRFMKPLFKPEWINAEAAFDKVLLDKILGSTLIDGRLVNNYYGLWEFLNEKNQTEYGYIFSVKPYQRRLLH